MKRSGFANRGKPMQRRSPLRATAPAKAEIQLHRMRRCSSKLGGCGQMFRPDRKDQMACGTECAISMAPALKRLADEERARAERKADAAKREAIKRIPDLKADARDAFNKWVRLRDAKLPCISCGAPPPNLEKLHAGRDAGHYRSTGAADHLRFHEDNCHAQCVKCNQWKAGNAVDYRIRLVERIGVERVEALECNNAPVKWTREGLREIRDTYRAKARELERAGR